jgi:hypothetical protein
VETADSTQSFTTNVRNAAIIQVHPCHVKVCNSGSGQSCEWNSTTRKLDCTAVGCATCDSTLSLCNASGQVITNDDGSVATTTAKNDAKTTCGPR